MSGRRFDAPVICPDPAWEALRVELAKGLLDSSLDAPTAAALLSRIDKSERIGIPPPSNGMAALIVGYLRERERERAALCACGRPVTHVTYNSLNGGKDQLCDAHFEQWQQVTNAGVNVHE